MNKISLELLEESRETLELTISEKDAEEDADIAEIDDKYSDFLETVQDRGEVSERELGIVSALTIMGTIVSYTPDNFGEGYRWMENSPQ